MSHVRVREAAFDADPVPQLVVDPIGTLVMCNERARALFNLSARDVGRPLQDLEVSYRPVELRSMIDQAQIDARPVARKDIEVAGPGGESRWYDVTVVPLMENGGTLIGTKILFNDISGFRRLQEELRTSSHELETAYEELQSTNEELQTTNEELQSANEELETTNEELQSANEEMETMNEELQSTNEELETVNAELRQRSEQLNQVNSFLSSILSSLRSGVIVLNRNFEVQIWNRQCEDLWGLRFEEVAGKNFLNLDIGLPVAELRPMVRSCLAGDATDGEKALEAVNRRGRSIRCRINCMPLPADGAAIEGAILLIDEDRGNGAKIAEWLPKGDGGEK